MIANSVASTDCNPQQLLATIVAAIEERIALDAAALEDSSLDDARNRRFESLQQIKSQVLLDLAKTNGYAEWSVCVERHVRALLQIVEKRVGEIVSTVGLSGPSRASLFDRLRADFVWIALLVDWLDDESFRDPALAIRSDVDRMKRQLAACMDTTDVQTFLRLDRSFDAIRGQTLRLRAEREIAAPIEALDADSSWSRRLALSRLRAELSLGTLKPTTPDKTAVNPSDATIASIDQQRQRLADHADARLLGLPAEERPLAWHAVVTVTEGDANEIAAYLQDAELPKAIAVLETALEDGRRLLQTSPRVAVGTFDRIGIAKIADANRSAHRMVRQARAQLQDKRIALRLERMFGQRGAAWLERLVLLLIFTMVAAIGLETYLESRGNLSHAGHETFAWIELGLCLVFQAEFWIKVWLSDDRRLYFWRHFLVDFLASIPFGFFLHHLEKAEFTAVENLPQLFRLLRLARLPALARYLQAFTPLLRAIRLAAFALKATDHLVQRHTRLFNQNVILFEPESHDEIESDVRHQYRRLQGIWQRRGEETFARLDGGHKLKVIERSLDDLQIRIRRPLPLLDNTNQTVTLAGSIRVEALVRKLTDMTPERLIDAGGQAFADSVQRYIRLFDVPLIRRLPIVRRLVSHREKGSAETASLAANYAGQLIQRVVDFAYYLADLQGTISGPIFLDRLGATLVKTTAGPAKRLLTVGISLLLLYGLVQVLGFRGYLRGFFDKTWDIFAGPVTVLGLLCMVPLFAGIWFRRIANQATEYCERIVEAQFAAQTKAVKASHKAVDERFLAERVIDPEIHLRGVDDRTDNAHDHAAFVVDSPLVREAKSHSKDEEMLFLRNVEMLYRDYLDGALFHRTDTKTTNQLLGNLALTNLRLSNLENAMLEAKQLRSLDLSRAGSILGGPYLWFNYINRIITQYTAQLIIDYNSNAIPTVRLASAPPEIQRTYRQWLAQRLGQTKDGLAMPRATSPDLPDSVDDLKLARKRQSPFLESVDFNAIDFLSTDETRALELERRYGADVAELLRRDRCNVVRFAFRSFPLHRVPLPKRTVNPLMLYQKYLANGRIIALPLVLLGHAVRWAWKGIGMTADVVRRVLDPKLGEQMTVRADTYAVARRKINRMRKPVFMRSLWMRARFDVEYVGLALPSMPLEVGRIPPMERDLDFIGANRRDRSAAEALRRRHREKLRWIGRWLGERKFDFATLPELLDREYPFLADRASEVVRAIIVATIVDHDDLFSLAASIEALQRCCQAAAEKKDGSGGLPANLPPIVERDHPLWYLVKRDRRPNVELFEIAGFKQFDGPQREAILKYLKRHRTAVQGWLDVLLGEGTTDPWAVWMTRIHRVMLRTDLWSDQMVALRTVQSLALLDLHHYCELVWKLGGYETSESRPFDAVLPFVA